MSNEVSNEVSNVFLDEIEKVKSDIELANTFDDSAQAAKLVSKSVHQLNYLMAIHCGVDAEYREVTKQAVDFFNALK